MGDLVDIGDVIAASGLPSSTLHYYERHGLISSAARSGLRRQYERDTLERIAVIALCQRAGFSLEEIRRLLATAGEPGWKQLVRAKLGELRRRMATLAEIERGLEHALECPSENILRCEHFRAELAAALPVEPTERVRRIPTGDLTY